MSKKLIDGGTRQLVSLLDMIELDLGRFASALNAIGTLGQMFTLAKSQNPPPTLGFDRRGVDDFKVAVADAHFVSVASGLPVSASIAEEVLDELGRIDDGAPMLNVQAAGIHMRFAQSVIRLQETMKVEARARIFLALDAAGNALWSGQKPHFGDEVSAAFPSSITDIEEAAKCLAVGRGTASVMHLMRATEVPLKALAKRLGIGTQNDWGAYIREIDKELNNRMKTAGRRSADELFYAEANEAFERVKRAWRNRTMHVDAVYTEERARDIFEATRQFMAHLAPTIHE